jgi:predicted membrane protein
MIQKAVFTKYSITTSTFNASLLFFNCHFVITLRKKKKKRKEKKRKEKKNPISETWNVYQGC